MITHSKVVVITGASSGIGEALALEYAHQGFMVYACGRNQTKLNALSDKSVNMYVCGPTVYSEPHIGNARAALTGDLFFRILKYSFIVL